MMEEEDWVRTQVQLTARQAAALKALSAERGESMAALVRRAVDQMLLERDPPRRERALAAVGAFASRTRDISARHDDHLVESYIR